MWIYEKYHPRVPIIEAASFYNTEMLLFFIDNGEDINAIQPFTKKTTLHFAVNLNNYPLAQYLLAKGIKKNLPDIQGMTPYDYAQSDEMKKLLKSK